MRRAGSPIALAVLCLASRPVLADVSTVPTGSAPAPAAPAALPIASPLIENIYAVQLNTVEVADGALVLVDGANHVYVDERDLHAWRLNVPATSPRVTRAERRYVRLDALGAIVVTIDDAQQRLVLTAPPGLFEPTTLDTGPRTLAIAPTRERGSFLNYDAHANLDTREAVGLSGAFEAGTNVGDGVLVTTELATLEPGRVTRLATTWQSDDIRHDRTWQVGDAFVGQAALGGISRFAGVRVASEYGARSSFVTSPEASMLGTAALPSTVDVYINNVLATTQNVDPGVFRINNLPQVDGEGNVRLVVRDLLGRQTVIDGSYFGSPALLRRGLDSFEAAAGVSRADYGTSDAYDAPLLSATERHGFTDRFTGEAHVEAGHDLAQSSAVGSWLVPSLGNVSAGAAIADGGAGAGAQVLVTDEISRARTDFGVQARVHSGRYADLSTVRNDFAEGSLTGHVGLRVTQRSSLDCTYAVSASGGGPSQRVFTATFGGSIGGVQIGINAIDPFSRATRYLSMNLLALVGHDSITATQSVATGVSTPSLAVQHNAVSPFGVNYAITATGGVAPFVQARATGTTPAYAYQLGFASDRREQSIELDLRGALARVDGGLYAGRTIAGSYGLAILDGLPGVDVSVNNAVVGRTDRDGRILIPDLQAYRDNTVSIDPQSLPLSTNIGDVKISATPYYRSPAIVRFKNLGTGGLIVPIRSRAGMPLAAGSIVIGPDGTNWPVADRGEAYVSGLTPRAHTTLHARRPDGSVCDITFDVPGNLTSVPTVAPVPCVDRLAQE